MTVKIEEVRGRKERLRAKIEHNRVDLLEGNLLLCNITARFAGASNHTKILLWHYKYAHPEVIVFLSDTMLLLGLMHERFKEFPGC